MPPIRRSPLPLLLSLPAFSLVFLGLLASGARAQKITSQLVVSGLQRPTFAAHPPGDADRLFIVEQNKGKIVLFKFSTGQVTDVLTVTDVLASGNEQGLLGMAFHPDFANNGLFFVDYTNASGNGDTTVARYQMSAANPDVADPSTKTIFFTQNQPFSNHNAGMLAFGPNDGFLYLGLGDGGGAGDTGDRAQDPKKLLGKMLRLDIDTPGPNSMFSIPPSNPFVGDPNAKDEIWALGLRNPWRYSFDPLNGDLYIADVGQNAWEEIDFQPASSTGGEDYGWRCMEGTHCFNTSAFCTCNDPSLVLPFHEYQHLGGNCAIIGGYLYRGAAIPFMQGRYFFADSCSNRIWSVDPQNPTDVRNHTDELDPGPGLNIRGISSFGVDDSGEIYICDLIDGEVFQIVPDLQELTVSALQGGTPGTFDVANAGPSTRVIFAWSAKGPGSTFVSKLGVSLGLKKPQLLGVRQSDAAGTASLSVMIPAKASGRTLWFQAAETGNISDVETRTVL